MRKVLITSVDRSISSQVSEHLAGSVSVLCCGLEALSGVYVSERPDAVIIDINGARHGISAIDELKSIDEHASIIALTCGSDMATTVEVIKKGAFDCIQKPVNFAQLDHCLKKVFEGVDLHRKLGDLGAAGGEYRPDAIVGRSRVMEEIFKTIGLASQSKVTILIQGESGTGKELIARAIHHNSVEAGRPFVAINCSALVETLLESELFGHEKGAFTGALFRKEGKFEAASGGTVFLDEIGEMSQALQVKLLRVLQERSFERVGGSETIRTDVRVIAATNSDLSGLVTGGAFREDLYYRLKVITIDVAPLRERLEDVPLLVMHLLAKANRELHKKVRKVPEEVMSLLKAYSWPGNVRELENVITRGVLLAKGDVLVDVSLPGEERKNSDWKPATLDDIERAHIESTLGHTLWNKSRAAVLLGVSLPRLERKIRKYGLKKGNGLTSR
ncbi:MAG: sigma-54-dependent Fis family transcriptional regulator [Deltaproteobacteria bacterium]|nr:sigma-54-dependent Fis family transcriptional regulator [Deltaproteobacteria bacterium]